MLWVLATDAIASLVENSTESGTVQGKRQRTVAERARGMLSWDERMAASRGRIGSRDVSGAHLVF
jgi:hypothetical protein